MLPLHKQDGAEVRESLRVGSQAQRVVVCRLCPLHVAGLVQRASEPDVAPLVLWGERDRSYSWSQVEMLWKTLPNAELAVMPGAAHAAHLEKPKLFHAILDDFLGTS